MTAPAETLAGKSAWCPLCSKRIRRGEDYIRKPRQLKRWCHARCAAGYEAAMEENAEADRDAA